MEKSYLKEYLGKLAALDEKQLAGVNLVGKRINTEFDKYVKPDVIAEKAKDPKWLYGIMSSMQNTNKDPEGAPTYDYNKAMSSLGMPPMEDLKKSVMGDFGLDSPMNFISKGKENYDTFRAFQDIAGNPEAQQALHTNAINYLKTRFPESVKQTGTGLEFPVREMAGNALDTFATPEVLSNAMKPVYESPWVKSPVKTGFDYVNKQYPWALPVAGGVGALGLGGVLYMMGKWLRGNKGNQQQPQQQQQTQNQNPNQWAARSNWR